MMTTKTTKKLDRPDYKAMAETLVQIAHELKNQAQEQGSQHDLEQAERLERIAAEIRAGGAAL